MKKLIAVLILVMSLFTSYTQWQPDVRLTNNNSSSYTSNRSIASNDSTLHVVWWDGRNGANEIYYKRSTDGGTSWGIDTRLTNNQGPSARPSISVFGSAVHVMWDDQRDGNFEIYYKHSTDNGITWSVDIRLTNDSANSYFPSVSVSGSDVHVVWQDSRDGNYEVYYKSSTDAGVTWGVDTRLTNNPYVSGYSSLSVSNLNVHVVWYDDRDGNYEIYYNSSTDGGLTWGVDTRLTNSSGTSFTAFVSVSNLTVHVLWHDNRDGNYEVYYKSSTDAGVTWGTDTRLTNYPGSSVNPSMSVFGSNVHVTWHDSRDGVTNNEIYYKRSTDAGVTWGVDTRLTNAPVRSENPSVAVSGQFVHVVWQDNRDGNYEIYYKRDPTGNPIGIINISSEIPSSYSLSQNYPNPFNPNTTIRFDITKVQLTRLSVYDALGKEVAVLVNEQLTPGTYETNWNASGLTSGVYFYKLTAGDYTDTKKMMLIK